MKKVGFLWDTGVRDWNREDPFSYERLNEEYKHFSQIGREKGVLLYPAHHSWYSNGELEKCFVFEDGEWKKKTDIDIDAVWDAFEFGDGRTRLKKQIEKTLPMINSFETSKLCKDKFLTYQKFPDLMPETLEATEENVGEVLDKCGKAVLKPRDDWGGEGVAIIEDMSEFDSANDPEGWIVQEFVDTTQGIPGTMVEGVHDLRAVVVSGEVITGFVRRPEEGFISNVAQGGRIDVLDVEEFPEEAVERVERVKEKIKSLKPYIVTVDMVYDAENEGFRLVELNSKPGMSFYGRADLKEAKTSIMIEMFEEFRNF